MNKILIVDDDIELCELLSEYLSMEAFEVSLCHNGETALRTLENENFELVVLDVMMPILNGFDTLTRLRQFSDLPVIMLTAKGEKIDRIVGLEMGADDYVPKPCDPRELVARIRAILRRSQTVKANARNTHSEIIEINEVTLDKSSREVQSQNQTIELTSTEFDLLRVLMENAGKIVSREMISEECLGKKLQAFDRSIDMHLSNVRKKLDRLPDGKPRIKTIRGSGYQYLVW